MIPLRALDRSLAACLILFLSISPSAEAADHRLHVGVISPLSGTLVASGESVRNAVMLADSLFDKSDLVDFSFEDDSFFPKNSVAAAKKFIGEKKDAIIIFGTPTAFAVVPITEQAGVPLAAITIVDRVVEGKRFAVRHFVAWQAENQKVIEEVRKRGLKRIALVVTVNEASLSLRDGFIKDAPVEVVFNEEFGRDDMDFRAAAIKVKKTRPDAIYHLLFAPQGSAFMKSLRQVGCQAPVFGAHNVDDPSEIAAAEGTYEGIWFVTGDESGGSSYAEAYKQRFGRAPAMGWANAFDYAKMIIEAAAAGIPVMTYMKELKEFSGVFGSYGAAPGNSFDLKAAVRTIQNGKVRAD